MREAFEVNLEAEFDGHHLLLWHRARLPRNGVCAVGQHVVGGSLLGGGRKVVGLGVAGGAAHGVGDVVQSVGVGHDLLRLHGGVVRRGGATVHDSHAIFAGVELLVVGDVLCDAQHRRRRVEAAQQRVEPVAHLLAHVFDLGIGVLRLFAVR